MKHLKKFNELFDSGELKDYHEIELLSNKLDKKELVNSKNLNKFQSTELEILANKLSEYVSPFFRKFGKGDSEYRVFGEDIYHFVINTGKFRVILSFQIKGKSYGIGVTYEKIETALVKRYINSVKFVDDFNIHYIEEFGLDFVGVKEFINEYYLPLLRDMGYDIPKRDFDVRDN